MAKGFSLSLRYSLFLLIILSLFFTQLFLFSFDSEAQTPGDTATIFGYVYSEEDDEFLENVTISVERDLYLGNETVTDENGYYYMRIPDGHFILRVIDNEGFIIFRTEFNISANQVSRLDFELASHNIDQSRVYGTVLNKFTFTPMADAELEIKRIKSSGEKEFYRSVYVDKSGKFSIFLPAGKYELDVFADEERIHREKFELNFAEEKEFEFVLEKPTRTFSLQNVIRLITLEWLNIVIIIIILIVGLILNSFADKAFTSFQFQISQKPGKFIDLPVIKFIERVVKWNIFIVMIILVVFLLSQILDMDTLLWDPIANSIASIYIIILLIIFMRISLMIWNQFIGYMKGGEKEKPKQLLSGRMLTIIDIIGKYLLMFLFLVGIVLTALSALGMSDIIIGGFTEGLAANAGFIIFIITLIVITWIVVRFVTLFFADMKTKSTRFRPEMIDIASKGIKFFLYSIIGMILIFTLLSAAGMGEIGQTLILVFSLIIGMVVSMAATGSIGNLLSGVVIMAFKPFEEGDWVIIADTHTGQIIEMNIMFTKLRDLDNEIIEIPNNMVLSTGIINWTMSGKKGGFAIEIDATIGYDVPAMQVIQLMKESCVGIPNLLEFPRPNVIISEFHNFAIGYKLRAYIQSPQVRFKTQTEIMINMQKTFTEAGVEILSPEYFIRRSEKIPTAKAIKGRMRKINKFESPTPPGQLKKI